MSRCGVVRVLAAEAVLAAVAVALLLARTDLGAAFLPDGADPALVRTFAGADLVAYVLAPAAAAWGLEHDRPWARGALWLHVGAASYAALWAWGLVAVTGGGLAGALIATPSPVVGAVLLRVLPHSA